MRNGAHQDFEELRHSLGAKDISVDSKLIHMQASPRLPPNSFGAVQWRSNDDVNWIVSLKIRRVASPMIFPVNFPVCKYAEWLSNIAHGHESSCHASTYSFETWFILAKQLPPIYLIRVMLRDVQNKQVGKSRHLEMIISRFKSQVVYN